MSSTMIRVRRIGESITDDLRSMGFVQVNVVSFCIDKDIVEI